MYTAMYTDVKKPDKTLAQDYQLFSFSFSCFGLRFCDLTKRVSLRWLISKGWRLATGWLAGWPLAALQERNHVLRHCYFFIVPLILQRMFLPLHFSLPQFQHVSF